MQDPPLKVRENTTSLIDVVNYNNWEDIKADFNGVHDKVLRYGVWTCDDDGNNIENPCQKANTFNI